MKFIKYILPVFLSLVLSSCSDGDTIKDPVNEVQDLLKVQELINEKHIVELFTDSGILSQGYNNITIRIKEKTTGDFVEDAIITWKPIMHMIDKIHSCPKSDVDEVANKQTIYNGYIIFQMPENSEEGWDLTINYRINGEDYEVVGDLSVPASDKRVVTTFLGTDDMKYVLALIEPQNPEVKINDMSVGLYRMENMMSFPVVANYTIKLDPRMPSMDNHSSPNNIDPAYNVITKMYEGKLSLTMTGYWKLNLMLYNTDVDLLKGEEVTSENESSSLFLEIEF